AAQGAVSGQEERARLAVRPIGREETHIAVEQTELIVVLRNENGPAGVPAMPRVYPVGFAQDLFHELVQMLHAIRALAQWGQDPRATKGAERRARIRRTAQLPEGFERPFPQCLFQARRSRERLRRETRVASRECRQGGLDLAGLDVPAEVEQPG